MMAFIINSGMEVPQKIKKKNYPVTLQPFSWVHIQKKQNQRAQRHLHFRVYDCTAHKSQSMKSALVSTDG